MLGGGSWSARRDWLERRFGLAGDGLGGLVAVAGDFEDGWGVGGQGGEVSGDVGPVDSVIPRPGSGCRRAHEFVRVLRVEVFVAGAVVVVEVELGDAGSEEFDGGVDAGVVCAGR